MSEPRVIKKYANRRLYDTGVSQYVTLDDIRRLVVEQVPFQVVDAKTHEDLTRNVLLQIILEQEEKGEPMFSTEFLMRVIRFYGDTLQGFMGSYLTKSVDSFLQQQGAIRKQMASLLEKTPLAVMTEMTEKNLELWRNMQDSFFRAYRPHRGEDEPGSHD
jgi:polyhydroxyalkanoate synthesis repressor PhaR